MIQEAKKVGNGSYSFAPFLNNLAPYVSSSDLALCQMENPLSVNNTNLTGPDIRVPSFNAPHELATNVANLGFDGCSIANNHTFDRGLAGLRSTRQVMAANGLGASGPSADANTPGDPTFYQANGLKIAHLSYSYTLDNRFKQNTTPPASAPWMKSNLYAVRSPEGVAADAAAARKQGADLVLVSMHWGDEYKNVNDEQREYANKLLNSGQVDWIIGNHPHVVQTCQKINGRYVNYALGNTMSSQQPKYWLQQTGRHVDDGLLATVTFARDAKGTITQSMKYLPLHQDYADHIVKPVNAISNPEAFKRISTVMSAGCDATAVQ